MPEDLTYYPLLTKDFYPEAVILADGDFPTHPLPLALLKQAKHVICCDGAANEFIGRGYLPKVIIGDGDSLSPENKVRFAGITFYSVDQETNDLTKAVEYCVSRQFKDIAIIGATGKREDHTLGNISLLTEYMDTVNVRMVTDYGIFEPVDKDASYESYPGQHVSIFNFQALSIKGVGLEFPLRGFTNWWQGTLNRASGNIFTIWTDGKILVFRAH